MMDRASRKAAEKVETVETTEKEKDRASESAHAILVGVLDAAGVTAHALAKKLRAELNAREIKPFKATQREVDQHGKTVALREEVIYSKPLAAWEVRQRARIDAHKLRGDYAAERDEPLEEVEAFHFDGEREMLQEAVRQVAERLRHREAPEPDSQSPHQHARCERRMKDRVVEGEGRDGSNE